jgi:hypothetical protein
LTGRGAIIHDPLFKLGLEFLAQVYPERPDKRKDEETVHPFGFESDRVDVSLTA